MPLFIEDIQAYKLVKNSSHAAIDVRAAFENIPNRLASYAMQYDANRLGKKLSAAFALGAVVLTPVVGIPAAAVATGVGGVGFGFFWRSAHKVVGHFDRTVQGPQAGQP
ncbi:MAG: hypothetical protein DI551_08690 [Micavibrio aeruginosavorus]|uniref:Uncharacterized protein n=1 Tax=Micavibrio aeruginosavorus TaxID=349221 RepID=A0A2W5MUT3_9BACT|nr:MAG: hypothetical protein DI551_08690 [Micavibrio aeruginosavorus]